MPRGTVTPRVSLDSDHVRKKWNAIKEWNPKVARNLRRDLRASGDDIIAAQRRILSGPLPKGIAVAGRRRRLIYNPKTGKLGARSANVYADREVERPGRGRGLRQAISGGLKTRVVIGEKRTGVRIQTTNAKKTGSNFWQSRRFRHPVWGREPYVYQAGQPYFFQPAYDGAKAMSTRIHKLVEDAFDEIPDDTARPR